MCLFFLPDDCLKMQLCSEKLTKMSSFLQMNVFSHLQRVANVPKSPSSECPTWIRLGRDIAEAGEEPVLVPDLTRTLDLD